MINKYSIFFIFGLFVAVSVSASVQNTYNETDSITKSNAKEYYTLGNKYLNTSTDTAILIYNKIINVSNDKELLNKTVQKLGKAFYLKSNYSKSIEYYKSSLNFYIEIENKQQEAELRKLIGDIYYSWGIFDKALEYYFASIESYNKLDENKFIGMLYNNVGLCYREIGKYKLALDFYRKSYKLIKENDSLKLGFISNNLGSAYVSIAKYDSAKFYFNESIMIKKDNNDEIGLAHSYGNLSDMYFELKDYRKSLEYLKKVKYISERHNDLVIKALVNSSLGRVYTKLEIYNLAEDYLKQATIYANKLKSNQVALEIARNFSDLYLKTNEFEKASKYLNKYILIKDSLFSENNIKKISELQVAYNMESNQKENEMLKRINKLNEQKLEGYKNIKHYFIIILVLIFLLLIVVYSRIKNNIKNTKIIDEKTNQIKEINSQLLDLNTQLKNKVDKRTEALFKEIEDRKAIEKELQISLEKEQKTNTLKDRFLSNISHEIRTPLNAISGLASLLNIKVKGDEVAEYVTGIYQNSNRLLNLLNNIIDFSKIESSELKLSVESINLNEVVNNVIQLYKFRINEKKLDLQIEMDKTLKVFVDKVYLSKILNEIIDNAVRYTNNGFIKISISEISEKEIYIKIADSGIGIETQFLPHIFDSFTQETEGYKKKNQGIGLGLPLSKKFIEMNKGRIEISSKKDKGTIVTIILPANENSNITANKEKAIIISDTLFKQKEFQIFLIEDDYFNKLMLETILDNIGIVTSASGGNEAIELIDNKHKAGEEFDIMIIDINLPDGWDGISLMHKIREKWPLYKDIIFIAQTAYANTEDKKRFLDSGFNEYITKPIDSDKLINLIKYRLMT